MKKTVSFLLLFFSLLIASEVFAVTDSEYQKALDYYNRGKYKESAELLREYVGHKPDAGAYYRLGYALYKIKRFAEADDAFREAYLLDPSITPQMVGPAKDVSPRKQPRAKKSAVKPERTHTEPDALPQGAPDERKTPESPRGTDLQNRQPARVQPQKTPPAEPSGHGSPLPQKPLSDPPKDSVKRAPAPPFPLFQGPQKMPPPVAPGLLAGLVAGFATTILIIEIFIYVFSCLCIYLIARKLDVPNPWLAWIPLVQLWTIISCAGKPWWWLLLLLVPIVNIIAVIALWMAISENLGRNKWLGLLMILPIINFIYLGMLAFSKEERQASMPGGAAAA